MLLVLVSALNVAALGADTDIGRFETPPLGPGVVCGDMPRLELSDILLTAQTKHADVVAVWGEPHPQGPGGEVAQYWLHCDARLWLSFEPDGERRLTRAVLLTGSFVPKTTVLIDESAMTRNRRCDQLPRRGKIIGTRVASAWGPPDNEIGSGMVRWTYRMADGGDAQVFPDFYADRRYVLVACRRARR